MALDRSDDQARGGGGNMSEKVLIVSSDGHVGLPFDRYGEYLEKKYLPALADVQPFPQSAESRAKGDQMFAHYGMVRGDYNDSNARLETLERDGIVAEVLFPGPDLPTIVPFSDTFSAGLGL